MSEASDTLVVREVGPDDEAGLSAVRELFTEYAEWLGDLICLKNLSSEIADLPGRYAPPAGFILLAEKGSVPVGCIAIRAHTVDGECEMKRLFVSRAHRGSGAGRALIAAALPRAAQAGYRAMVLNSIEPQMAAAIALYRDMGFSSMEPYSHTEDPVPGMIHMRRRLVDVAR